MEHHYPRLGLLLLCIAAIGIAAAVVGGTAQASPPQVITNPAARPSGIYVFFDWSKLSPDQYPIVGGHMVYGWAQIEVAEGKYDWSAVDKWLGDIAKQGKRGALAINTYEGETRGGASIPAHHKASTPQIVLTCSDGNVIPRYWDASYQRAFADMVRAFGARYGNDPRVAWVEVSAGIFGETAPAEDRYDPCLQDAGLTSGMWVNVVNWATDTYRSAFPATQLFLQYAPRYLERSERRMFSDYAASRGVGLKHNGLSADAGADAFITDPALGIYGAGQYDPLAKWGSQVAVGFEGSEIPTSMEGRTNTLWSLYNALDKHADFLMLDTKVTSAADRQDLLRFASRYLGRTINDTPSVWVALRETEYDWFPDYGNFEFWLYQNDAVPGGKTTPLWKVGTAAEGRFTRRTDQASGNSSMYFDVDDNYAFGGHNRAIITVTYLDTGADRWELRYDSLTDNDRLAKVVQKRNTKTWQKVTFDLADAEFANGLPGGGARAGSDFRIWCGGDGNETVHFVEVTVLPATPQTLTLAPGANGYDGLADTYLDKWLPAQSNGALTKLWVRYDDVMHGLLRFDLAALPANARVMTATLSLYQYGSLPDYALPMTIAAHRILRPWDELTASWNQAAAGASWEKPGANGSADRELVPASSTRFNQRSGWAALDITSLAQAWAADPGRNYGVLLRGLSDRGHQYSFYSGNFSNAALRPRLVIEYYEHVSPPPVLTSTATPTRTVTPTRTATGVVTATRTPSPSPTASPTRTPGSGTPVTTATPTATVLTTPAMTETATLTATATATATPTATPADAGLGRIHGRAWLDGDRDRQTGVGEPGIAGLSVRLARIITPEQGPATEEPLRQVLSGIDGAYLFDALPVGHYVVSVAGGDLEPTTPARVEVVLYEVGAVREVWFGLAQSPPKHFLPWVGVLQPRR